METLKNRLYGLRDEQYAAFQAKLTPGIPKERFIGVRVPLMRRFAAEYLKEPEHEAFLKELPHETYDENLLHGLLISQTKEYDACIKQVDAFLPYVDNWAVCDTLSPKVFAKHKTELLTKIREWTGSKHAYTCRFGIEMLMNHYLDADFKEEYPDITAAVQSEEYYVNMMIAWYFATALAKQWKSIVPYLEQKRLAPWVHRKTIRKACESYRITEEQKAYLKTLI